MLRAVTSLSTLLLGTAMLMSAQNAPMLRGLDKSEALRGDKVTVTGQHLAKPNVAGLYLTKGNDDIEVTIEEQTDTSIRFVVGKDIPFGRYGLLVLTGGETPVYIDQPVKLNVVEKLTPKPEPPAEDPPAQDSNPPGA